MCRHGHEFGHGLDAHLFHHFVTMGLDGALCRSKLATDLVVMLALNHEVEDLSLARGQRQKASVAHVGLDLQLARSLVASNRSFDRAGGGDSRKLKDQPHARQVARAPQPAMRSPYQEQETI